MASDQVRNIVLLITAIFLIAPFSLLLYIFVYNQRKKRHIQEKAQMKLAFDAEIAKTQLEVQEQTMQTVGAELHDNIGQLLSLTSLTLNSIELDDEKKARQKINDSIDLTLRSIKEMRLLGHILQGDQLVAIGLVEAIRQLISWMDRSGRYRIVYTPCDEVPADGNPEKDLIIFRMLQEVFNNIIKHAVATEIAVRLEYEEKALKLCVSDNGIGFDTDNLPAGQTGMGLQNIRKRAGIIGGEATITSQPGEGSVVTISIPYP